MRKRRENNVAGFIIPYKCPEVAKRERCEYKNAPTRYLVKGNNCINIQMVPSSYGVKIPHMCEICC